MPLIREAIDSHRNIPVSQISTENKLSRVDLTDWTLSEQERGRLQHLNQEITDLREQLELVEDWDYYESVPLKYNIMLRQDERRRMAADFQRKTERKIAQAAEEAWNAHGPDSRVKVDPVRDEIDWVCAKLKELVLTARGARSQDRREIESLIKSYRKYWQELMTSSGRIRKTDNDRATESPDLPASSPRQKHRVRTNAGHRRKRIKIAKTKRTRGTRKRPADLRKLLLLLSRV